MMSLPLSLPGPMFIRGGVYDVTSCLAAWSHVPLLRGSAFEGGLPLRGVCL